MLVFAKTIVKYKAEFPANHVLKELGNLILSSKLTKNEENLVLSAMAALYLIDETFQIEYREKTKSKVNESYENSVQANILMRGFNGFF